MKKLTRKLNAKFRSPDEPALDWFIDAVSVKGMRLVNYGLGAIHLLYDLLLDEDELVLRFEYNWAEEESNLSKEASNAFRAAVDYVEGLGEIVIPVDR